MNMNRKRQAGVTLVELAVSIGILAVLVAGVTGTFAYMLQGKAELETKERLQKVAVAVTNAYRAFALTVDNTSAREFRLSATEVVADATTAANTVTATTLARIASFGQVSPSDMDRDEYQGRHTYFVSNRMAQNMPGGYQVFFRKIAIVSPGYNGALDAGTAMDPATGTLTLGGDDIGMVVDGFQIQRELTDRTIAAVTKIANAYQSYFTNRYLANPARDISINYFANSGLPAARWDTGGLAANSGGTFANAQTLNFAQALGVSNADLADAYGRPIEVDNSSDAVRNPANATAAMQIPPYSATVRAQMPGGIFFQQTAIGGT